MPGDVDDIFDQMKVFDNGLRLGTGEKDVARAITALNIAQHFFESVAATMPDVFQATINVGATSGQEKTALDTLDSTLLRLDALWMLDPTTLRPIRKVTRIEDVGAHVPSLPWPLQVTVTGGSGQPLAYYANLVNFYWLPLPDGTSTMRIYGLLQQPEFTAHGDDFNYSLQIMPLIANFAVKVLHMGVDDDTGELTSLANSLFRPTLRGIKNFDRSEPSSRYYTRVHTT